MICLKKKTIINRNSILITAMILALFSNMVTISMQDIPTEVTAQTGSMSTLQNIQATYTVSIVPGAAQRDNPYHYYPPVINVPIDTTVGWFNNDFGQPHTVTSGAPNSSDAGSIFNSGIMPATANSFFQHTFTQQGDYLYHCLIHPWRVALVSVADAYERGHFFQMSSGVGSILNLTQDSRTLLDFEPLTIPLDSTTPLAYNVTIIKNSNDTAFSKTYVTAGQSLPLELIQSEGNETITYGPDFSSTGTYHVEAPFLNDEATYTIVVELIAIDSQPPEAPIIDEFSLRTVT